jgi:hypothetical protein
MKNMIIYQISLPEKQDTEAFVKFMQAEYFPAVHKGVTRETALDRATTPGESGQVTDLVLLQAKPEGRTTGCEFFWQVGWSGPGLAKLKVGFQLDDETVAGKLESFKAPIERLGFYSEVAAWHEGEGA